MAEPFAGDPTAAIERAFERIGRERMADVPIVNPALAVRAIGFACGKHGWLGVLVTPWCMNLMLLPAAGVAWGALPPGAKRIVELPAGGFEFIAGDEASLGEYQAASLFSPMFEFADQASAEATARAALLALVHPRFEALAAATEALAESAAASPSTSEAAARSTAAPKPSRRAFFGGSGA